MTGAAEIGAASARRRLDPSASVTPAPHWIPGRRGLTFFVDHVGRRSVYKVCSAAELELCRQALPGAPIPTPELYRAWDAEADLPPAVELEYIPDRALADPCYRFAPDTLPFDGLTWRTERLDTLFARLGQMHGRYVEGRSELCPLAILTRCSPESDSRHWEGEIAKLQAERARPGAKQWLAFWGSLERPFMRVLNELYDYPLTWIWGDAKWDHVACRDDGTVVVLEWSALLGPAGSDLYLCLFESAMRRDQLLSRYAAAATGLGLSPEELSRYADLGLARACFLHGIGQATLSVRGVAGGTSTDEEKALWAADARITAERLVELLA